MDIEEGLNAGCWTVGKNINNKNKFFGFEDEKNPNNTKINFDKIDECNKKFSNAGAILVDNFYEIYFFKFINKKLYYGIFNISSDESIIKYDWKNIVMIIFKESIKNCLNKFDKNYFTNRPLNMCLSNKK